MVAFGLIVSFLVGAFTLLSATRRLTLIETAGLSFPTGIAVQSVLMILADTFSIPLNASSMLGGSLLFIAALAFWLFFARKKEMREWIEKVSVFKIPKINMLWLVFLAAVVAMEMMNFTKCIYIPVIDRDSLTAFDTIGKIVAAEQTFHNLSLFRDPNFSEYFSGGASTISYTPLVQCSYAYLYMLGAATSKWINALHYLSFIIAFYGVTRRFVTDTAAMFATLFAFATPEFISFSSLSGTNVIHAFYASLGILYLILWNKERDNSFLGLSALLLWFNIWTRNEGVAFAGIAIVFMLIDAIRKKSYKPFIGFSSIVLSAFVLWNLYLAAFDMKSRQIIIFRPFWDGEKIQTMGREMWNLFVTRGEIYYGWTIVLFALILLSNCYNIWKHKDQVVTLFLILGALFVYTLLLYQIDYIWDAIENVIRYSYKRFFFSFAPLFWFYIVANRNASCFFNGIDRFVYGK